MNNKDKNTQVKRNNLVRGLKSINLIPPLTEEQVVVEKSKIKLNVGASISLLFFFVFTLGIVGFNIFAKQELNSKKNQLYKIESELNLRDSLLSSNDEILKRINLYQKIEAETYSVKDIVLYLESISKGLGTIDTVEITEGKAFLIAGSGANLTEVSKLWYVFGNDAYIESVNLKTVSKDSTKARFTFEGVFNLESFEKKNG
jgi:hypothetical protein